MAKKPVRRPRPKRNAAVRDIMTQPRPGGGKGNPVALSEYGIERVTALARTGLRHDHGELDVAFQHPLPLLWPHL